MIRELRTRTVIVGTGPGGATLAKELAGRGEDVIILEKGRDHQWPVGRTAAYVTMYDIKRSADGVIVRRGITTGGSTMLYSGNSFDPPPFMKGKMGIDLSEEVAETKEELSIHPVPEFFFKDYVGTLRLVEAADALGYHMQPQERFIDPKLCDPACDRCLFGCAVGAKWTSRSYLKDAVASGAKLITRCDVKEVLVGEEAAEGVLAKTPSGPMRVHADRVILAAGAIGTPVILKRSGVTDAGSHFFTDPMSVMVGVMKDGPGTFHEITYTFADLSNVGEFVIGNVGAVNALAAQIIKRQYGILLRSPQVKRMVGMFVKLCDEPTGSVDIKGNLHKKLSPADEERMARGVAKAKAIMTKAGVIPETISVAKGIGGHPGGTAAVGRVIGNDLQTEVKNLYVCDNSIMPHSGGIPPVLTLIALAKKTARTILA